MGGTTERAGAILDRAHRTTYHEQDGRLYLNSYQDVEPHLEYAAKCRRADSEERGRFGKRGDLHRTMAVPFNVMLQVAQKLGIAPGQVLQPENSKRIWKELKSSDYKNFRTTNGRL
jgi:hypothetical protein